MFGEQAGDMTGDFLSGFSSSFLMREVMSKPLKGFWSVVLAGEMSFSSVSRVGLGGAGLGRSVMISQSVISVDQAGPGHETKI